ncbi:MAG: FmdB family zinc ribbon protein [Pseudomonadota bacterium]
MPIYAYRCEACGFAKDVLQKLSDAPLTECLSCGKPTFKKQLTAAGFQLKGTGWYVTDFRGGSTPAVATAPVVAGEAGAKADAANSGAAESASPAAAAPASAAPAAVAKSSES